MKEYGLVKKWKDSHKVFLKYNPNYSTDTIDDVLTLLFFQGNLNITMGGESPLAGGVSLESLFKIFLLITDSEKMLNHEYRFSYPSIWTGINYDAKSVKPLKQLGKKTYEIMQLVQNYELHTIG